MRHLSDGALRRLYDEPYALDEETRAHYSSCPDCQARFTTVADDARHAMALMAVPGATVDAANALTRVKSRRSPVGRWRAGRLTVVSGGWRRPVVAGLAAAALAGVLIGVMAFTPLAATLVDIFQPTRVTPVTVTRSDFQGLDAFASWGDVKGVSQGQMQQTETAGEASRISGLPPIKVDASKLPASLQKAPVSYAAVTQSSGSVTFNSNAPARLRGSTLTLVVGPAETTVYGDLGKLAQSAQGARTQAPAGGAEGTSDASQRAAAGQIQQALNAAGPILAVAEMSSPRVSSTGASVADIKSALLAQPGLSQTARDAISSFDDPKGNLPIPIPAGYVNSHSVRVQGVAGTAFGDSTGLGIAVIWIKNGKVYGVAGTVTEDRALAVADSLR